MKTCIMSKNIQTPQLDLPLCAHIVSTYVFITVLEFDNTETSSTYKWIFWKQETFCVLYACSLSKIHASDAVVLIICSSSSFSTHMNTGIVYIIIILQQHAGRQIGNLIIQCLAVIHFSLIIRASLPLILINLPL